MSRQDECEHGGWVRSVVERFEGRLLRYAVQITGDPERARDVVQDTFLQLCRADREQLDGRLDAWLFHVCRNRALDVRRKENRMTTMTVEQAASAESLCVDHAESVERHDTAAQVLRLVEQLTDNQREVVRLKFQNDLSYREISEVTGLSIGNVGYLLHTAIQKIRLRLGDER